MGIRFCCCSTLAPRNPQEPEFNKPFNKAAVEESRDFTPAPSDFTLLSGELSDVATTPRQIRDVARTPSRMQQKQLEVTMEDLFSSALSIPLTSRAQSVIEHESNVELSVTTGLSLPQSSNDTLQDINSPEVSPRVAHLASLLIHSSCSRLDTESNESREVSPKKDSNILRSMKTLHLIKKVTSDMDDQVNEETAPVSQIFVTRALSEDYVALDAQDAQSNSTGVNSCDVSWLRKDFEPDFFETVQLAEEKMSTDDKQESVRMQTIEEEESKKNVTTKSTPVTFVPLTGRQDDETEKVDTRKLPVERNIPMTIEEDELVDPKKGALLNDVITRSKSPKLTNKEMRALKRKLVDAYIEAIPSSRRQLTMISIAVDHIWKDVTDRSSGNLTLLGNKYNKELKWLRSKKDENTKKEKSRNNILTNVKSKLHSRAGVVYTPNFDDDPKHKRYKTPAMDRIIREEKPKGKS